MFAKEETRGLDSNQGTNFGSNTNSLSFWPKLNIQCNLDLVKLLVSTKNVTKSHNVTNAQNFYLLRVRLNLFEISNTFLECMRS